MNEPTKSQERKAESQDRHVDRSPVIALLLAQYRGIQTERLVVATSMRALWFVLLLVFALAENASPFGFVTLSLIAFALFFVSFYSSRRTQRLEAKIRDSLVRLDPDLEDYYIKVLHEARDAVVHSPLRFGLMFITRFEDGVWFMMCLYIAILRSIFMRIP